jgi:hypothetical protein
MPDYSNKDADKVPGLLKDKGSPIGEFNQTSFRKDVGVRSAGGENKIQVSVAGKELGGGYCAGVALDWARRVLLSSPTRDEKFLSYGYSTIKKGEGIRSKSLTQSKDRAFQTVGRMANAWDTSNNMSWTAPSGSTDFKVSQETWNQTKASLDSAFNSDRSANQRGPSSRKFSSLVVLDSKMTVCTADEWVNMLPNSFQPGAVTKFGFGKPGATGHAVAVWRRKATVTDPDSFYFFDPNFGVYSYKLASLTEVLKILFYRRSLPPHTPYYVSCSHTTTQDFSYIIFGPPNLVSAGSPSQPVINPQPSPTTLQPANGYGTASPSIPSPGMSSPQPVSPLPSAPTATGLKGELQSLLSDPARQIPEDTPFGPHGCYTNGWVYLPFSMISKIEKNDRVKGYKSDIKTHQSKHAIPRDSIGFMLARL